MTHEPRLTRRPRLRQRRLRTLIATSAALTSLGIVGSQGSPAFASAITDIAAPDGSEFFGSDVTILDNGNFVVVDSGWSSPTTENVGAVYLYDGTTRQVISKLTGSTAGDRVGIFGITVLESSSNFVVSSPWWDSDMDIDAGASTWVNGTTGLNGVVSTTNSIYGGFENNNVGERTVPLTNGNYVVVSPGWGPGASNNNGAVTWAKSDGTTIGGLTGANTFWGFGFDDQIGSGGVIALPNGHYVILSPRYWDDRGAITWGNGSDDGPRTVGNPDPTTNTLEGNGADDMIGSGGVTVLGNSNYVVSSPYWHNGALEDAGAFTWGDGTEAIAGWVDASNSIVGSTADDSLLSRVVALSNGNYVVSTPRWDNGAKDDVGAVTWGNGAYGTVGEITALESLHGLNALDEVGSGGIFPLSNGNYVVASPQWSIFSVGAVTWVNGSFKATGEVNPGNSIVGSSVGDEIGENNDGVVALTNGNYVVLSPSWNNGAVVDAGAATFANGSSAGPRTFGSVTPANSLVGTTALDRVGSSATALANGNYVVSSTHWDNGPIIDAGALTWGNGTTRTAGPVTPENSLVGTTGGDSIGGVTPLVNGNYVARSRVWDNGAIEDAGATTWGRGDGGTVGAISSANSLVGTTPSDQVGQFVTPLSDGNYVVDSYLWHNGTTEFAGAVTWASGANSTSGPITAANSLIGTATNDLIGSGGVFARENGAYVVRNPNWNNGAIIHAGAVTYGHAGGATTGQITADNSVLGVQLDDLNQIADGFTADGSLIVGRDSRQIVTLFRPDLTPPMFASMPADIAVAAAPGDPTAIVSYTTPAATEDDGTATVACTPPSGSEFGIGTTTVTCTATNAEGLKATTSFTVTVTGSADYIPLPPARVADTRPDHSTIDGLFAGIGALDAGQTLELTVGGRGGVPNDAVAAALNVTVTEPGRAGYVTVYPCGAERPTASNLNFTIGATVPNAVVAKIGDAGKVCIYTSQPLHLVVDVNGAFPASTTYRPGNPARVIDTRPGQTTVDGVLQGEGAASAGSITRIQITGRAGVPIDASAVALNVTVTEPDGAGYATVFPCGTEPPTASNLNYTSGLTVANLVISKIGLDGAVCVYTQMGTQLVADVNGYFPADTTFTALDPARLLDTRADRPTIDGLAAGGGIAPLGSVTVVHVGGRGGVPVDATTVVLNVTATEPDAAGYVTVYPCGIEAPLASNLNFVQGQTVPNASITKIGSNGDICVYSSQATHLVADVTGYFP